MAAVEPELELASWMDHGHCRGKTHLFFPPAAERPPARARREARARRVCLACPVLTACRSFARRHHEYGFWGGESEDERHRAGFNVAAPIGVRARASAGHEPPLAQAVVVALGGRSTA